MQIACEVVNRTLDLRGPTYAVGERLTLDTDSSLHRAVLAHEGMGEDAWVRRLPEAPPQPAPDTQQRAVDGAPADRMVVPGRTQAPPPKGGTAKVPGKTVTK